MKLPKNWIRFLPIFLLLHEDTVLSKNIKQKMGSPYVLVQTKITIPFLIMLGVTGNPPCYQCARANAHASYEKIMRSRVAPCKTRESP